MRVLKKPFQAAEVHWLSEQFWSYQKQDKGPGQKLFILWAVILHNPKKPSRCAQSTMQPTVLFLGYTQAKDKAPELLPTTSHA